MSIEIYLKPILGVGGVYFKGETIFVLVISLLSVFGFLPLNQKTKSWIPPPPLLYPCFEVSVSKMPALFIQ